MQENWESPQEEFKQISSGTMVVEGNIWLAIKKRKHSLRTLIKHNTIQNRIEYKKDRAIVIKLVNTAKQQSWDNFVQNLATNTSTKEVWDGIRKISPKYVSEPTPAIQHQRKIETKPEEISKIMAKHFENVSSSNDYAPRFLINKQSQEQNEINFNLPNNEPYNNPLTFIELKDAIKSLKGHSAGPDKISPEMLRNLSEGNLSSLLSIYNKLWTSDQFPKRWKEAIIIPILKPESNK